MNIAIHQPNYMPWAGYFYKMAMSDVFVLLDNVQYEKNGMTNRVRVKTSQGPLWLTVPVKRTFPSLVKDVEIADFAQTRERHQKTIEMNYKRAPFFDFLFPGLVDIFGRDWTKLSLMNTALIMFLREKLGIVTRIEIASHYPEISGKGDDCLIALCKLFHGDLYLSGTGGKNYQNEKKFEEAGIRLAYSDFQHPRHLQLWGEYVQGLSILDLLMNCGPQSREVLLQSHSGNA